MTIIWFRCLRGRRRVARFGSLAVQGVTAADRRCAESHRRIAPIGVLPGGCARPSFGAGLVRICARQARQPVIFAPDNKDVGAWTLQEVLECGTLHFECTQCWKISELQVPPLLERFGAETSLGDLRRRMRCRKCRSRKARVLVRLRGVRGYSKCRNLDRQAADEMICAAIIFPVIRAVALKFDT